MCKMKNIDVPSAFHGYGRRKLGINKLPRMGPFADLQRESQGRHLTIKKKNGRDGGRVYIPLSHYFPGTFLMIEP